MWRKWWLLFSVIWFVVAAIQVAVILGTSEEPAKAIQPFVLGIAVPAALYALGWIVERLRRNSGSGS
jgi:hypothetical protein